MLEYKHIQSSAVSDYTVELELLNLRRIANRALSNKSWLLDYKTLAQWYLEDRDGLLASEKWSAALETFHIQHKEKLKNKKLVADDTKRDPTVAEVQSQRLLSRSHNSCFAERKRQQSEDRFKRAIRETDAVASELISLELISKLDGRRGESFNDMWPSYLKDPVKFRKNYALGFARFYGVDLGD